MFLSSIKKISLCLGMIMSFLALKAKAVENVINLNATGVGSFTEALINVDEGGVINFDQSLNGIISVASLAVERSMIINGNPNVIIDGGGTYQYKTWITNLFQIQASNVIINDLHVKNGNGPNAWDGSGVILIDGIENITFENCSFNNNKAGGLINSDWTPTNTSKGLKNIKLINCSAKGNTLRAITLVRTNNLTISGGEYHDNQQGGIYLERSVINAFIDNVEIHANGLPSTGNTNGNYGAGIRVYDGGSEKQQSKKITITNSKIYNNNIHGIELPFDADSIQIFKNEIYGNGTGTSTGAQACGISFQFGGNDNCIVAENNIYDNRDAGIYMYHLDANPIHKENIFHKNTLNNNGGGIILFGSENAIITENIISNTTQQNDIPAGLNGIFLGDASNNSIISQNTIQNTQGGSGIYISDQSVSSQSNATKNIAIVGNIITNSKMSGILIENSSEVVLGESNVTDFIKSIVNHVTGKSIDFVSSKMINKPNTIKENDEIGVLVKNSYNVSISKDSIYCNNQHGKIVYEDVTHTTIQSNQIMVEKIGENLTLKNLQIVTNQPIESFLFEASTCTDSKYNYLETKSLDNQGNLTLTIPNLGTIDSLLLFVTNAEGNTFPVVVDLNQIITTNENIAQNSIVTFIENGLFVIENGQNSKVMLSNSNGVIINNYDNINELTIGNNLPQGLYLIHIENNQGESFTKKYIKL